MLWVVCAVLQFVTKGSGQLPFIIIWSFLVFYGRIFMVLKSKSEGLVLEGEGYIADALGLFVLYLILGCWALYHVSIIFR